MQRYDWREALKVQGLPQTPIGAVDELKEKNLPLNLYASCAEPSADGTIRGCPLWHQCTMSYKGLTFAQGGGPRNHCWERLKSPTNGGGVVRNSQPCFWGIKQQEVVYENKDVLRVIANEGEEYETLTYILSPTVTDVFNREQKLVKFKVPAFPRPGQEKKIATQVLRADIVKKEQERVRNEAAAAQLGVTGGSTPLDRRSIGGGRGGKKEG